MAERNSTPIVDRAIWPLAAVVVVGSIMSILDTTIVNVALETLSVDLSSPVESVQWVVTGYMLALAAVIPVTGWAARRIGTRRLYLMSLVLFTLGSVLCGFAWSIDSLIVFRVLQGLGGGMLMPTGMIILRAPPAHSGSVASSARSACRWCSRRSSGRSSAGSWSSTVGWRWIFFVNVPVGILAVSLALRFLPAGRAEKAGPLDWLGVLLLSTGLPTLTYGLAKAGSGAGFASPQALVPMAAGLLLTTLFVFHSLRSTPPAAQRPPLREPRLRGRLRDDLLSRRHRSSEPSCCCRSTSRSSAHDRSSRPACCSCRRASAPPIAMPFGGGSPTATAAARSPSSG